MDKLSATSLLLHLDPRLLICGVFLSAMFTLRAADFHVAPDGNDGNAGTESAPFASVARAQEAVRELRRREPARTMPVVIQIRGGTYQLNDTLRFRHQDSGTEVSPTVYEARKGERPILSGGRRIANWQEVRERRWETVLPEVKSGNWRFCQLYVDDQRRPRPRAPKKGYFYVAGPAGQVTREFLYAPGDIDPSWRNLGDIEMWSSHKWTDARIPLESVNPEKRICTLAGATWHWKLAALARGIWYRLENVAEALDEPGEWYLDRPSGRLTYLARPSEAPGTTEIIAPRLTRLVSLDGNTKRDEFVEHVVFRGLTFAHCGWNVPVRGKSYNQAESGMPGAVHAVNTRHVVWEDCVVRHTGNSGVVLEAGCVNCRLERCELVDLGACGVRIGTNRFNDEPDKKKHCAGNVVRDCLVAHIGRVHPPAVGLLITHAHDNVLEHNEVFDTYYSAISVGWRWATGTSAAHHNRIEYNHLHDIGQGVQSDMGGIYTLGESPGTVERFNRIHNVRRARYGGWGIYFDESSADIIAENNLVYDTEDAPFHLHHGRRLTLRNNIFAFGQNEQMKLSNMKKSGTLAIEGNIWYYREGELVRGSPDEEITFKRNLYWNTTGTVTFPNGKTDDAWRSVETDFMIADPGFVDAEQGDFRFTSDSPAPKTGFKPFDMSTCGRLTKTTLTAELPPVPATFDPAPPEPPVTINQDFEALRVGHSWPGWGKFAASREEGITVTDKVAASGTHSLCFHDGPGGAVYFPHLYLYIKNDHGVYRTAFDLCIEKDTNMEFVWRDNSPWFTDGPNIRVKPGGKLESGGRAVSTLPFGKWVHVELRAGVGDQRTGDYSISVTLPDDQPKVVTLPLKPSFGNLGWIGFLSLSKQRARYHVDNFELQPVSH